MILRHARAILNHVHRHCTVVIEQVTGKSRLQLRKCLYNTKKVHDVNNHGILLSNFVQFIFTKLNLKAQINSLNSLKSPMNSYLFFSLLPPLLNAYKPGFPSYIHISTGTRLPPPPTNHQIYSRQIFQWIWASTDMLETFFQCILTVFNRYRTPRSPQRIELLNGGTFSYISHFQLILLLYCWPFIIFHSLPHHSNSTPQIQFIFYNSIHQFDILFKLPYLITPNLFFTHFLNVVRIHSKLYKVAQVPLDN